MIRIAINGVMGKMGSAIVRTLGKEPDIQLIAGVEVKNHPMIGKDIGETLGADKLAPIIHSLEGVIKKVDCMIEFTNPEATINHLKLASSIGTSCVIGTTGFTSSQRREIEKLTSTIPCVLSPNMARGVNLMFEIVQKISAILGDYDCEIVEAHHREKKDSPSGTALKLAEIISKAKGKKLSELAKYGRTGFQIRTREEIGIHSIRAGEIVGKHTVLWVGGGEKITISHEVHSREAFARGTIMAIRWVVNRAPGLYTMKDVLGL